MEMDRNCCISDHANNSSINVDATTVIVEPDLGVSPMGPSVVKKKRGGRVIGQCNYNDEDLDALVSICEEFAPELQWERVAERFSAWAKVHGRPQRDSESLRRKFDRLCSSHENGSLSHSTRRSRALSVMKHSYAASVVKTFSDSEKTLEEEVKDTSILHEEDSEPLFKRFRRSFGRKPSSLQLSATVQDSSGDSSNDESSHKRRSSASSMLSLLLDYWKEKDEEKEKRQMEAQQRSFELLQKILEQQQTQFLQLLSAQNQQFMTFLQALLKKSGTQSEQ